MIHVTRMNEQTQIDLNEQAQIDLPANCKCGGVPNYVTRINEWCQTYKQEVMAHIWMSHSVHANASWHKYKWVMLHVQMIHGALQNNHSAIVLSCLMSHATPTNESSCLAEDPLTIVLPISMSHGTRNDTCSHIHFAKSCVHSKNGVMAQIRIKVRGAGGGGGRGGLE